MLASHVLIAVLGAVAALAGPPLSRRVLHEGRNGPPQGWTPHRRADPDVVVPLKVALRQSNIHELENYLLDVADPGSPNYGQWWAPSKVIDAFRPPAESLNTVHDWLSSEGVDASRIKLSKDHSYVHVNVSIAEAERILATTYYVYRHTDGSEQVGCHQGYHLPEHVVDHVDFISPTVQFETVRLRPHASHGKRSFEPASRTYKPKDAPPKSVRQVYDGLDQCDTLATIPCIQALYEFNLIETQTSWNSITIVELERIVNAYDLQVFLEKFNPGAAGNVPNVVEVNLAQEGESASVNDTDTEEIAEGDLDVQIVAGLLSPEQNITLLVNADGSFNHVLDSVDGSYCTFDGGDDPNIDGVVPDEDCGTAVPSLVYSVAFTVAEALPPSYMQRMCTEIGKLSLLGMTFLFISGSNGVASNGDDFCLTANGTAVPGPGNFLPNFPSTCPFVTAVGGTQIVPGNSVQDPETSPFQFASGGGFSNVFPRPHFQNRHVENYLQQLGDRVDPSLFNRTGRAIPDVAANGGPTTVVIDGNYTTVGGTAVSVAIFAAMVTAINDARLVFGKSPVGWINPAIYSLWFEGVFNDVTNGTNPGCGTDGFPALPGWDPVTGLGTPNFPKLLERFLLLP
ncbi:subtilisin-like protein [Trametes punicea]|nr:subtilisin-like protein [Trametes punicea]